MSVLAPLRPRLELGMERLTLRYSDEQVSRFLAYGDLLLKWNQVYNLTAIREPQDVIDLHLLDCLSLMPTLAALLEVSASNAAGVLDVGSGAGLPAALIAIAFPEVQVTAIDSVEKKIAFQRQAAAQLHLSNWLPLHTRIENYTPEIAPTVITARAYSSLLDFVATTYHLTQALHGDRLQWLAMKGKLQEEELLAVSERFPLVKTQQTMALQLPGVEGARHLITLTPTSRAN